MRHSWKWYSSLHSCKAKWISDGGEDLLLMERGKKAFIGRGISRFPGEEGTVGT